MRHTGQKTVGYIVIDSVTRAPMYLMADGSLKRSTQTTIFPSSESASLAIKGDRRLGAYDVERITVRKMDEDRLGNHNAERLYAIDRWRAIISAIEGRCMAADGPVSPTLQEMTESELRRLWELSKIIGKQ